MCLVAAARHHFFQLLDVVDADVFVIDIDQAALVELRQIAAHGF